MLWRQQPQRRQECEFLKKRMEMMDKVHDATGADIHIPEGGPGETMDHRQIRAIIGERIPDANRAIRTVFQSAKIYKFNYETINMALIMTLEGGRTVSLAETHRELPYI